MFISNVCDLVDLLGARSFGQASTELGDDKRNTKTLRVLGSLTDSLLVPFQADISIRNLRLASSALFAAELAAVSVVIKHVLAATDLTAGWSLESDAEDVSAQNAHLIGERHRFEPHLLVGVVSLVLLKDLSVKRCQVLSVHVARHHEHWVSGGRGGEGLVQWVVTNDVGVRCEAARNVVPVADEFVGETVLVGEQGVESSH